MNGSAYTYAIFVDAGETQSMFKFTSMSSKDVRVRRNEVDRY